MKGILRSKYRRVIMYFMMILLVFNSIVVAVIVSHQQEMSATSRRNALRELHLVGAFARDAMLRHDYATLEEFLMDWGREHEEVVGLRAVSANGFVIAEYVSAAPPDKPVSFSTDLKFNGRDLLKLEMTRDFASVTEGLNRFILCLGTGSVLLSVLLGLTLWYTLKTLALRPMEQEISRRKQAEKQFKTLLESAPDSMVYTDTNGRIVLVNEQTEKLFGYSREELEGQNIEILMPERFRSAHRKQRTGFFASSRARPMGSGLDLVALRKDGGEIPVDISLSPIDTEQGVFVLADIRDITKRKRAEERIRQSYYFQGTISSILQISLEPVTREEKLERILDTILSIPSLASKSAGCLYLVEDEPDVLVMKAHRSLPEATLASCAKVPFGKCLCGQAAAEGKIVFADHSELLHDMDDGKQAPHGHYCVPIHSGNKILGALNLFVHEGHQRDAEEEALLTSVANTLAGIIERERTEQEKERLQVQLSQAEKLSALGRLTANVAHEIRNPLTSVGGFARRLLKRIPPGATEKEYADIIVSEVDRLENILRNVLTYSRESTLDLKPHNLNEIAGECLRTYEASLRDHSINVKTYFREVPPVEVDKAKVLEAIYNLFSNAVDSMPGGGSLTVSTLEETVHGEHYLKLEISDTGGGIADDKLKMIFEPFFSTKDLGRGTGLGLSICKKIMEDHAGFIRYQSEFGEGSTFSLYFPYNRKQQKAVS